MEKDDQISKVARQHFARQLRKLRVARGFKTARSLAKALDIDENRYTRYERAEVEPDLGLLQQMCRTLSVTPNELLLNAAPRVHAGYEPQPHTVGNIIELVDEKAPTARMTEALAWRLASVAMTYMTGARRAGRDGDNSGTAIDLLQETTALYRAIMEQPFSAIDRIVSDPLLSRADCATAQLIHDLSFRLAEAFSAKSGSNARRSV